MRGFAFDFFGERGIRNSHLHGILDFRFQEILISDATHFRHIQQNSDCPLASSDTYNKIKTHAIKFRQINVHPKYFDHTGAVHPLE